MKELILDKIEDIKIFTDPFKIKIMNYMKLQETPLTVKEIADGLNEVPSKIHYHVKKLEDIGVIKISKTKEINGIIAKYYTFTTNSVVIKSEDLIMNENFHIINDYVTQNLCGYFDNAKKDMIKLIDTNKGIKNSHQLNKGDIHICPKNLKLTPSEANMLYSKVCDLITGFYKTCEKNKASSNYNVLFSIIEKID